MCHSTLVHQRGVRTGVSSLTEIIIAVDPGKLTGLALLSFDRVEQTLTLEESVECDEQSVIPVFRRWLHRHTGKGHPTIVCERFVINSRTVTNSAAPWSLECIGAIKQAMRDQGMTGEQIVWQSPANAKSVVPNDKLKRLGTWHRGGAGHANDAIRHGVLYTISRGFRSGALVSQEIDDTKSIS